MGLVGQTAGYLESAPRLAEPHGTTERFFVRGIRALLVVQE